MLSALVITMSACSKSESKPTKQVEAKAPSVAIDAAPAPAPSQPSSDAGMKMISAAPAELYPAAKLDKIVESVSFVGWSADSNLYAVRVSRGLEMGALGGDAAATKTEVYDARTGRLVEMFRYYSNMRDAERGDPLRKSWKVAKPAEEWDAYAKSKSFVAPSATVDSGKWKTTIEPVQNGIAKVSKLTGKTTSSGAAIEWLAFPDIKEYDAFGTKLNEMENSDDKLFKMSPVFNLGVEGNGKKWRTLRLKVPYGLQDLTEGPPTGAQGSLTYYWAPSGDRFVIVADWEARGMHEEYGTDSLAGFYARTAGPQIKVVSNEHGSPLLRNRVEGAGFAVTVEEIKADVEADNIQIYYRGAEAKTIADKLAQPLGNLVPDSNVSVKELTKPGWLDLIVFAGDI
jgi:hypothetical protein